VAERHFRSRHKSCSAFEFDYSRKRELEDAVEDKTSKKAKMEEKGDI